MRVLSSVVALASCALVAAQSQIIIDVGGNLTANQNIFQFSPSSVNASAGTVVTFRFSGNPGNHSITQSSFATPCQPLSGGFDSGWVFVPQGNTASPEWNLTITNDTIPLWFYCKQLLPAPHCTAGMVGAINAPATGNTFSNFVQAAQAESGAPGQGEGALVGQGASASAGPGPLATGVTAYAVPGASATAPASGGASSATTSAPATTSTTSGGSTLAPCMSALLFVAALAVTLA